MSRKGGARRGRTRHVVCIANRGFDASLERRKIYIALHDAEAAHAGMLRVIDESGEDYLYPKKWFADIRLPPALAKALAVRHNAH